jgi:S-adenosylmethionine-diacylgycerolhomoserine-N-methlytransferase
MTRWSFLFGRRKLLDSLPSLPTQPRVLEVGCGTGTNIKHLELLFPDAKIYGVDLSHDMLQKASDKIEQSEQVTLVSGRYGSEDLEFDPFDLILLSYTLTMTGDQVESILQTVANDLKPEGYIAVVDFHTTSFNWFKRWMKANHVNLNGHLLPLLKKYFRPSSVKVKKAYLGLWSYFRFIGQRT